MSSGACESAVAYAGSVVNPVALDSLDYINYALIVVDARGTISNMDVFPSQTELDAACLAYGSEKLVRLNAGSFLLPGFIDMHTHAPQYRNLGVGYDDALLEWLEKCTFPEETWYGIAESESMENYRARISSVYGPMVRHYLACGTTTACYFGSLQLSANKILVDEIKRNGQRALVGQTCMDCRSPATYVKDSALNLEDTKEFVRYIRAGAESEGAQGVDSGTSKLVMPVITPRFALSCTSDLLKDLGDYANTESIHVQSHMSENKAEIAWAQECFPSSTGYGNIYDVNGLLTDKTFMAHCIHTTEEELKTFKEKQVAISHCPCSNFALSSGVMDMRRTLSAGIRVGLGTDVAGGYSVSLLDTMRQAIIASKVIFFQKGAESPPLKMHEVVYLATLGGAVALGMEDKIGSFSVGKQFDALLVDPAANPIPVAKEAESLYTSMQRFVFTGDDRWIKQVFVCGRECKQQQQQSAASTSASASAAV